MDQPYAPIGTSSPPPPSRGFRRPRLAFCGLLLAVVLLSTVHPAPRERVQQAWQEQRYRFSPAEDDKAVKLDKIVVFGDSLSDDG